ncbi:competence protein ComFA [Geomicrobium halophilum]|uniref:Competence protein ComFA n=1 Tax=Geomicrobium halophilum TaxID=549000 RepID=A0A841PT63_9BACL|nr:DEAD/DEAH box helicase [Geomicrobium halophilum]MBB6450376.1 competence protein ComFA [Geomicrobium halophilum]
MKVVLAIPPNTHSPLILPETCLNDDDHVLAGPVPIAALKNLPLPLEPPDTAPPYHWQEVQALLNGRALLPIELPFGFLELRSFIRQGYVHMYPGITIRRRKHYHCRRCGNQQKHWFSSYKCSWCNDFCVYCRSCIMMGRVTTCTPLFTWNGPVPSLCTQHEVLAWQGTLSPLQKHAADRITETIISSKSSELLIWAVCGAGKTEMLFPGFAHALKDGKRVLLATPRTDVVLELMPRLKRAFPTIALAGLYGGSSDRLYNGQLVVATTHQTRRFQDAFDVVIIDEVDAFPYRYDKSLAYAVQKAAKTDAVTIYLTATPEERLRKRCEKKEAIVQVNRRFHGHPLPVPSFQWAGDWRKALMRGRIILAFSAWFDHQLESGRRAVIFVPSVQIASLLRDCLQKKEKSIVSVHASDPDRKEIVHAFRNGEMPMLVTTTILERGVTFYGIDVAVLGAEDDVFTESALVQIAGRAGRSPDDPHGNVTFFHYGKTKAMNRCRKQILSMNRMKTL